MTSDLHSCLDNIKRGIAKDRSSPCKCPKQPRQQLWHAGLLVIAPVEVFEGFDHKEPNRLIAALFHHRCSQALVCSTKTWNNCYLPPSSSYLHQFCHHHHFLLHLYPVVNQSLPPLSSSYH